MGHGFLHPEVTLIPELPAQVRGSASPVSLLSLPAHIQDLTSQSQQLTLRLLAPAVSRASPPLAVTSLELWSQLWGLRDTGPVTFSPGPGRSRPVWPCPPPLLCYFEARPRFIPLCVSQRVSGRWSVFSDLTLRPSLDVRR